MDAEAVRGYVRRASSIVEASPDMDEATTKASLIRPFVELLGWSVEPSQVRLDQRVDVGEGSGIVDYVLMVSGEDEVYIVASGTDTEIRDDDVAQFRRFLPDIPVDHLIVTNGITYEILVERAGGDVARVGFDIEDLEDRPELLGIVEKEGLETGEAETVLRDVTGPETADVLETLRENKVRIAREVSQVVKDEVGTARGLDLAASSGAFVQRLIDQLEAKRAGESRQRQVANGSGAVAYDWTPEPGGDAVAGTVKRSQIEGPNDAPVAVFAVREPGLEFVRENNAWGAIHLQERPDYVAIYVRGEVREVRYVGTVHDIIPPEDATFARDREVYESDLGLQDWKRVLRFQADGLYELEDPIPYESRYPLGTQVTSLRTFRSAATTDDLF